MRPRLIVRLPGVDHAAACDVARQVAAWASVRPHLTATVLACVAPADPPTRYAQVEVADLGDGDLLALAAIVEPFVWPAKPQAQLVVDPVTLTA